MIAKFKIYKQINHLILDDLKGKTFENKIHEMI